MGIEDSLIGSYLIGTKEEIQGFVSQDRYFHPSNMSLLAWVEFGLAILSGYILPNNVEHFVDIPLFVDLAVRGGSGIYNSVKRHLAEKKLNKSPRLIYLLSIDPIPENPGLVGRVRELIKKVA